ncbi:hypothetical protein TNIN_339361 [Trichonephila inaurata madagascariensis]|uniref:Uncharacterized protein n=1 Tax=Trichonephila inaurata madagascariensis TaxID=2747483 RepID=A0A8X7CGX3_9ARAC|nr:hypothetical protein TNIN_339361 [Trichonephila inaurata madagascariensis]
MPQNALKKPLLSKLNPSTHGSSQDNQGFIFQQDSNPCDEVTACKKWLQDIDIHLLEFPHLNPNANLWSVLTIVALVANYKIFFEENQQKITQIRKKRGAAFDIERKGMATENTM